MKIVTLDVSSLADVEARARAAFKGNKQGSRISFASPELMFRVLTANRWGIMRTMAGAGPMALDELARRLDRDVRAVRSDAQALHAAGVLRRTDAGEVVFPFDAVHVNFIVKAA
jgi:predicted transcriptional regulator